MIARPLQLFFVAALLVSAASAQNIVELLQVGRIYQLGFPDVDGRDLSMSDGHVTIVVVMTRPDADKARLVGDRVPKQYKGDPNFRLVTLINFQQKIIGPFRGITQAVIRRQLDQEAARIQATYDAKKLTRKARQDLFVVADFDGAAVAKLGMVASSRDFVVFIFNREGRLVKRWSDVPDAADLAAAIRAAS